MLAIALVVGLATAADYGVTIDEFNTNDYGPKALAWYTSGFTDRSQFGTVEFSLWYYGPWFQMLTAAVQSLGLADPLAIRHALTFAVGSAGSRAPSAARLSFGRWVGPAAIAICLSTGYLYGNLFFAPIDGPFLAAMCWATLAILAMGRTIVPTWPATICAGLTIGLAIATRTGGIITHPYLVGVLALAALEAVASMGPAARGVVLRIALRGAAAIALAWVVAIALWPWLQIGNPFTQFKIRLRLLRRHPDRVRIRSLGPPLAHHRPALVVHPGAMARPPADRLPGAARGRGPARPRRRAPLAAARLRAPAPRRLRRAARHGARGWHAAATCCSCGSRRRCRWAS